MESVERGTAPPLQMEGLDHVPSETVETTVPWHGYATTKKRSARVAAEKCLFITGKRLNAITINAGNKYMDNFSLSLSNKRNISVKNRTLCFYI
jgi:hypothetical protein